MAVQGCGIDDLVECEQAEIDGHQFDDGAHAAQGRADAGAGEAEFRKGGIADAFRAELG
jgi:hypothetical protein